MSSQPDNAANFASLVTRLMTGRSCSITTGRPISRVARDLTKFVLAQLNLV